MSPNQITGHVEFADNVLQQSLEDAAEIVRAAEEEAKYATKRADVLDHMSMNFTRVDDRIFERALREGNRQDIVMMLDLIQKSFNAVVAEKKSAILEKH